MPFKGQNFRHRFAGGWASDFGPQFDASINEGGLIQVPFLVKADNVIYQLDGGPRKVGGASRFNSSAVGGGVTIRGLFDYWKMGTGGSPANRRIVHISTTVLADNNDATFASIDTGLEADKVPSYAQLDDEIVWCTDSVNDVPKRYDSTTVNTWAASIPFTTVSMVVEHKNRIWCAGDPANPSVLYASPLSDESGVAGDWAINGVYIQINPGDGDQIVGLASHKNSLFVFKGPYKGSIHRILGSGPTGRDAFQRLDFLEGGLPAVAHNAIFPFRNDLAFMCCDGTIHSLSSTSAFGDFLENALSFPIHEWLQLHLGGNQLHQAWGVDDNARGRAWICVAADTATTNNRILSMDYRFDPVRWSLLTAFDAQGVQAPSVVVDTTNSDRPQVWIGGTDGFVRKFNQVTRSIDTTTSIAATVRTPHLDYGNPINMKTIYHGGVSLAPKGDSTITMGWQRDARPEETRSISQSGGDVLAIDQTPTPASGAFTLGTSRLGGDTILDRFADMDGEFRSVSFSFANAAVNEDMEIHGFMAGIAAGSDSLENP